METALVAAFQEGNPAKAWDLTKDLVTLARELVVESARVRFHNNFGTPQCANCEGLKAGPGVLATCFQVRQCYFTNIKETDTSARQALVINELLDTPKSDG